MRIIENVKFNKLEREAFSKCRAWFFMMETDLKRPATEDERKTFNCLSEGNSLSMAKLRCSIDLLLTMKRCAEERLTNWSAILPSLPEDAEGIIMKPKLMAKTIIEASSQAVNDISEVIGIVDLAVLNMKGSDKIVPGTWEED